MPFVTLMIYFLYPGHAVISQRRGVDQCRRADPVAGQGDAAHRFVMLFFRVSKSSKDRGDARRYPGPQSFVSHHEAAALEGEAIGPRHGGRHADPATRRDRK